MILAVILSFYMFGSGPGTVAVPAWTQTGQQPQGETTAPAPPQPSGQSDAQQTQPAAEPKASPPPDSPAATPKPPSAAKPKHEAAAKTKSSCNAADHKATATNTPAAAASSPANNTSTTEPPPCGPAKVVIRNGGTGEAAVQLTGGPAAALDSPQRTNTNRLLGSTEQALKKIATQHLDSTQQETVKQVHEYTAQSKAALAAGDLDLAHNLAQKAQLLVDQLMKPQP